MKYIRTPIVAEVDKYEVDKNLEDGFELWTDVITRNEAETSNLIKIEKEGNVYCPYISTRRGKTFIKENDYIIVEEDGTKLVCGGDKVALRYQKIED